jgi:hypothetical protein
VRLTAAERKRQEVVVRRPHTMHRFRPSWFNSGGTNQRYRPLYKLYFKRARIVIWISMDTYQFGFPADPEALKLKTTKM